MKWVLNYKKGIKLKYWLYNFMIVFGGLISTIFTAMVLGVVIDKGLNGGQFDLVVPLLLCVVLITIVGKILSYVGILCMDNFGEKYVGNVIKQDCYKKINDLDQEFFNETPIGELTTVMTSDMWTIRYNICYIVKTFLGIVLRFVGALCYCLFVNWKLTILIMIPMPIIGLLSKNYIKTSSKLYQKRRNIISSFNNYIQENIEANRLVKNFGVEQQEIAKFKEKNKGLSRHNYKIRMRFINFYNRVNILSESMIILLVFFGGIFTIKGWITIGQLVAFSSLVGYLRDPFIELGSIIDEWQNFGVSVERIKKLLGAKSKIKDIGTITLTKEDHEIVFDHVGVQFDGTWVLKNISFKIEPGKTYAFIGPVGSGKSTITRLLLRFVEPTKGKIQIDGIDIKEYTMESLRDYFGYVSQTTFLFSDTIRNNVSYSDLSMDEEKVYESIDLAEAEFVYRLPEKIETIIGENGVSLSGGEKQRLSLARALAKNPKVLILDDITSALDFETEIAVSNNIAALNYACTKLIIAQKIFSVKDSDCIFVLQDGKISEEGTHKELLKKKGFYHEIYKIQKGSFGGEKSW